MKINPHIGNVGIKIDTSRIDRNTREAQKLLNEQIVADCDPLVPFRQGPLRQPIYPEGIYGGVIEYDEPYAHYQYMGIIYGPNIPITDSAGNITGYYSPPKKYPTGRPIQYHTHGTTDHWFERAKERNLQSWVDLVRKTVGKE